MTIWYPYYDDESVEIEIELTEEELERITEAAKLKGETFNEFANNAIKEYIEKRKKNNES